MTEARVLKINEEYDLSFQIRDLQMQIWDLEQKLLALGGNSKKGHFVKSEKGMRFVLTECIVMIEGVSNYSNIYLEDGSKIFTSKTLGYWERLFLSD